MRAVITAERVFRVERSQESAHYVSDVASDTLFVVLADPPAADSDADADADLKAAESKQSPPLAEASRL